MSRNTTIVCLVVLLALAAVPSIAQEVRDPPTVKGGCPSCQFDTRTFVDFGNVLVESITAYGGYWNYDANTGNLLSFGLLDQVVRYTQVGPCSVGETCTFNTRTFWKDGTGLVEIVTANGTYFEYRETSPGVWWATGIGPMRDHHGGIYNEPGGPCYGIVGRCEFDARSITEAGGVYTQVITARDTRWTYIFAPPVSLNWQLTSVQNLGETEYVGGACPDTDDDCVLDSMGHGLGYESITSYDRYWSYLNGNLVGSGCLADVDRYKAVNDGPCP